MNKITLAVYILITLIVATFRYHTGRVAWWIFWRGAKCMISPDMAHGMFLPWIAWTYWQPKWLDFARNVGKSSNVE